MNATVPRLLVSVLAISSGFISTARAQIAVSVWGAPRVQNITAGGGGTLLATLSSPPEGLAYDRSGDLYVGLDDGTVRRISPSGTVSLFASGFGTTNIKGLAIDSGGNLYVAHGAGTIISKVTPTGVRTTYATLPAGNPYGLAFDAAGSLFVASPSNHAVYKVSTAGAVTVFATANLSQPLGIAVNSAGEVFVANHGSHTIYRFAPQGGAGTLFANTNLNAPWGLALDASGNLYAANFIGDNVARFTPSGTGSVFATGLSRATGIAVFIPSSGTAPTITNQPQSQSVAPGGNVTLSVTASGTAPLSYQWQVAGSSIPGGTSSALALTNIQAGGTYTVVVSNSFGTVTSLPATITVSPPATAPTITTQPQSQSVVPGGSATLNVVASGTTPLSYQWQLAGSPIPVATNSTLTLSNIQVGGNDTVVVSNSSGAVTSNVAVIVVSSGTVPAITAQPQSQTVARGANATFAVAASGTAPLNYQWRNGGVPIAGATNSTLTVQNVESGGSFSVVVTNSAGSVTSSTANLTIAIGVAAPTIVSQPASITLQTGQPASLAVTGTGEGLRYQWQLNGADIVGATGATLALPGAQHKDVGEYEVVVSNLGGSVTSRPAMLNLVPGRLSNLSVLTPIAAGDPLTVGAVIGGGQASGVLPLLIRAGGPSLSVLGVGSPNSDPRLDVFSGPSVVASNDNWGGTTELNALFAQLGAFPFSAGNSRDAALAFGPNITAPPASYTVQVNGVSGAGGPVIAEVYDGFPSGLLTATTPRLINMSVLKQIPAGATLTAGFVIGPGAPKQVLIRAVGPTLGTAPFNVSGVMPNPKVTLFGQGGVALASNDDWGGDATLGLAFRSSGAFDMPVTGRDAALLVTLAPGSYTAQVAASTARGEPTGGLVLVEVYDMEGGAAPTISALPATLSAMSGATVIFSVNAVGGVGYQWQRLPAGSSIWVNLSDGDGFAGTTTASLLAGGTAAGTGDQLRVVVTNSGGATRSDPISVTMRALPTAITVAGFTAPVVAPMSLITIPATGLTPDATTYVDFLTAGALVAQVPAVEVTADSVTVAVPPLIGADGSSAAGTLSARIGQFVAGRVLVSNSFTAVQLEAAPASKAPPGALALGLLQAQLDATRQLLSELPGSGQQSATTRNVLDDTIQSLSDAITSIQRAMSTGSDTFMIGANPATSVTITQRDLQALDNVLLATLQAIARPAASSLLASGGRVRAASSPSSAVRDAATNLAQANLNGGQNTDLGAAAKNFVAALRGAGRVELLTGGALVAVAAAGMIARAPPGVVVGALFVGGLSSGAALRAYLALSTADGISQAPPANQASLTPSPAVTWARLVALLGPPPAMSATDIANISNEIQKQGMSGLVDLAYPAASGTLDGGYLQVGVALRNGARGFAPPLTKGFKSGPTLDNVLKHERPRSDPLDEVFVSYNAGYYPFAWPCAITAVPQGGSVFTGWRVHSPALSDTDAPFEPSTAGVKYVTSAGDPPLSMLDLKMSRGGLLVIATFDIAHTLTIGTGTAGGQALSDREAAFMTMAEGSVQPTPDPKRYLAANGVITPPSYLRRERVKLEAKCGIRVFQLERRLYGQG